jgi:hypothetical protein
MGHFHEKLHGILSPHLDPRDPVELCDYGTIQGGSELAQELRRAAWQMVTGSSTSAHKAHSYVAVAVTARAVVMMPVKFATGLLGMKFKPIAGRPPELYPRQSVLIEVGPPGQGRQPSVPVRFTMPDGSARQIEFYDNPQSWPALAARRGY